MTKEQLETNLSALKLLQSETNDKLESFKQQVQDTEKKLEDVNKPELTPLQLDNVQEAIESAVGNFDFDDADNYNKEFELDHDGRVQLSHLEFENAQELIESIVEKVHKLFVESEASEL